MPDKDNPHTSRHKTFFTVASAFYLASKSDGNLWPREDNPPTIRNDSYLLYSLSVLPNSTSDGR